MKKVSMFILVVYLSLPLFAAGERPVSDQHHAGHGHGMHNTSTHQDHTMSDDVPNHALGVADITVKAKGLVCSFCAQGIKKAFQSDPAIEHISFDSEYTTIFIYLKPGQVISDDTIKQKVTDSGYVVEDIIRK